MSVRLCVAPEALNPGPCRVTGGDFRYLARVLRLGVGDAVTLFDGEGNEAPAKVANVDATFLTLEVGKAIPPAPPRLTITLVCALLKADKTDWMLQKATELGVHRFMLTMTERTIARPEGARLAKRLVRWRKIAREAARQCGRADVPEVVVAPTWAEALDLATTECDRRAGLDRDEAAALKLIFLAYIEAPFVRRQLPARPIKQITLAIGPEGGFTPDEADAAERAGFLRAGLGQNILRAETAALAAVAVVNFALGGSEPET